MSVEAIAKAIYEARFPDHGTRYGEKAWQDQTPECHITWLRCAHAAGAALITTIEAQAAEIERLSKLVRGAYTEGFSEGMREHTHHSGGKPWNESAARAALEAKP